MAVFFDTLSPSLKAYYLHDYPFFKTLVPYLGASYFFTGPTRVGKTFLMIQYAKHFIDTCLDKIDPTSQTGYIRFIRVVDALDIYLKRNNRDDAGEARRKWEWLQEIDVLLIDDLGVETDWQNISQGLFDLIDFRLTNALPTVISSNLNLQELSEKHYDRISGRIYDMLDKDGKRVISLKPGNIVINYDQLSTDIQKVKDPNFTIYHEPEPEQNTNHNTYHMNGLSVEVDQVKDQERFNRNAMSLVEGVIFNELGEIKPNTGLVFKMYSHKSKNKVNMFRVGFDLWLEKRPELVDLIQTPEQTEAILDKPVFVPEPTTIDSFIDTIKITTDK